MKILFYQWHSFMNKGIEKALDELNIDYDILFFQQTDWEKDFGFEKVLAMVLDGDYSKAGEVLSTIKSPLKSYFKRRCCDTRAYDVVISINYSPNVSRACQRKGIRYVSWIYDSPINIRDIASMKNDCNDIYIFDRGMVDEFALHGIKASHLPLAADTGIFAVKASDEERKKFTAQVSLVGNLYQTEYNYMTSPLVEYDKGYLEGVIKAQSKVYGGYLIPELITDDFLKRINETYKKVAVDGFQMGRAELEFLLASEVTGRERFVISSLLSNSFDFALYSSKKNEQLGAARQLGYVDYYSQMPIVFANSAINLNITLKTIRTGIPLRVIDVMGCGGFVMSSFQEELAEYFEIGKECEVYENIEDLYAKCKFYLENDELRKSIALNGYERVKESFTFKDRLSYILG